MQSRHIGLALMLACAAVMNTRRANADLAPPADYVENCTVAKQQVDGKLCVACASSYATVDKCKDDYSGQGYIQACKSWGASVWTEVWCKAGSDAGANIPVMPQGGATAAGGAGVGVGGAQLGAGGGTVPGTGGANANAGGSGNSAGGGGNDGCALAVAPREHNAAALVVLSAALLVGMRRSRHRRSRDD